MKTHLLKLTPAEFCDQTRACEDRRIFALKHKTMPEVWDNCPNTNWLLWILDAIDAPPDEKNLRLFAVWCARNTPLADGRKTSDLLTDPRSLNALDVAERFAHEQATKSELESAWYAAYDAACDAARDATWYAARESARDAARYAARYAAHNAARYAAQYATWYAARDAARDAAWYAARYAARNAARYAQAAQFIKMIANPFR